MGIVVSVLAVVGVLLPQRRALVQHCWAEPDCKTQGWYLSSAFLTSRHPLAQCKTSWPFYVTKLGRGSGPILTHLQCKYFGPEYVAGSWVSH